MFLSTNREVDVRGTHLYFFRRCRRLLSFKCDESCFCCNSDGQTFWNAGPGILLPKFGSIFSGNGNCFKSVSKSQCEG